MSILENEIAALNQREDDLRAQKLTADDVYTIDAAIGEVFKKSTALHPLRIREMAGETVSQQEIDAALGRAKPEKPKPVARSVWSDSALSKQFEGYIEVFSSIKKYVDDALTDVEEVVKEVGKRLKALEARPEFSDEGVWIHDKTYTIGNGVTEAGSYWLAKRDTTFGERPGASDAWRLAVKRGRDGRQ